MALKDLMKYIIKEPGQYFSQLFFGGVIVPLESLPGHRATGDFSALGRKLKRKITKLIFRTLRPKCLIFLKPLNGQKKRKLTD